MRKATKPAPQHGNGDGDGARRHPRAGTSAEVFLITGGCGFIGTNLAHALLERGHRVRVYDNLSRRGVERNLRWLQQEHGSNLEVEIADVRDTEALREAMRDVSFVYHFAAQVAVTTSLQRPLHDFEVNAGGTLNVLEAIRSMDDPPPIVYTSTNKVYGALEDLALTDASGRYEPSDSRIAKFGVNESRALDFHSPYGCSKGTADQYIADYARSFGFQSVVFRMSCIYGPHQFGNEDQGWVAHFVLRSLQNEPITLYGDGRQVRDILFVEDLVDAFLRAKEHIDAISGQAFNIGGGPRNAVSLLQLLDLISSLGAKTAKVRFDQWRTGDQRYYVSDTSRFREATGWMPRHDVKCGVQQLYSWLAESRREERVLREANITTIRRPLPVPPTDQPIPLERSLGVAGK